MRRLLNRGGLILGLLADQSSAGMRAPFLGRDCNVGLAPAILALRYQATLSTAICYRIGLAKWRVEIGKPIPTNVAGHSRKSGELMLEVNRELEAAVRRDPANWFWSPSPLEMIGVQSAGLAWAGLTTVKVAMGMVFLSLSAIRFTKRSARSTTAR